jgi:LmbE family N-acetylglucosaminyl deacetylase
MNGPHAGLAGIRNGETAETVAVIVAHPDDETVAMGGHLRQLREPLIVIVTDGAPRDMRDAGAKGFRSWQDYAAARRKELLEALSLCGIQPGRIIFPGIADKEAARNLAALARLLATVFSEHGIGLVFTHAFEGGHPDHDATAFAVNAACRLLDQKGRKSPAIFEMPLYHAGATRPVLRSFCDMTGGEIDCLLDGEALALKQEMLACFVTQREILSVFPPHLERYRPAPPHDFARPPNGGHTLYEEWGLGISTEEFTCLCRQAMQELHGLEACR